MGSVVLIVLLVLLAAAVVALPVWRTRRRKAVGLLTRYQTIAGALLDEDWKRAGDELKEIIRADTEDLGAYLRLARLLQRQGDRERAILVRRSLLARDLRDREAKIEIHGGLLEDLLRLKRFEEAARVAEELRHLERRSARLARAELEIALELEQPEEAQRALDRLRRTDEDAYRREAPRARTALASLALKRGDRREAERLLHEALKVDGDWLAALLLLGDHWCEAGEHERAVELWTDYVRRSPEGAGHLVNRLERAFFELGRFGDLERFYESLLAEGRPAAPLRLALARMALRKGDAARALGWIEDLLQLEPAHAAAQTWRLYLLGEAGRAEEARKRLRQAVDATLAGAEEATCPECAQANPLTALRCPACRAWLSDPVSGRPGGSPSGH